MNIKVKNWCSSRCWETTVGNFASQHMKEKAMGRFLDVLVNKSIIDEKDLSYIFER